jgi:hypothetical protein
MNSMLESNGFSKPQLKSLTLENCRLSSFYLKSILKYTKELEDISLFNVSIDTLSIESEKINFIQISNCRLKYIAILPGFIEELILSENDLRHFDFPNTVIQQLDIHNNKLKRIPVFDYKSLKALDISFNRISDSLELNDLAALKYLYFLENDRFVVLNSNANQLVAASWFPGIASHSNLSVVFLPGNRLLKKFRLPQDVTYIPKRLYEYRIFSGNGFAGSFNSLLLHRKWNDQQAN